MDYKAMYEKYYEIAKRIIAEVDPDGSLSRAQRDEALEERDAAIAREKATREEYENYKREMETRLKELEIEIAALNDNPQLIPLVKKIYS